MKNTKNITFTSTIEEVHSQITQKSNQKNSNTKEALKLKNSSNEIQENLENFQGYHLLIAVGIRVESRGALILLCHQHQQTNKHNYFCSTIPCLITCVSNYLENDLKRSI